MNTENKNINNEITFISITKENINQYKKLRKIFAEYKIHTLRNHGEAPGGNKMFYKLFDNIILRTTDSGTCNFIVMMSGKYTDIKPETLIYQASRHFKTSIYIKLTSNDKKSALI